MQAFQARRATFESALRRAALAEPGLTFRTGHADRVLIEDGRAAGVVVGSAPVAADVVLDAAGRSGRLSDDILGPFEGGSCGFSYVSRMYRQKPGVDDLAATTVPMGAVLPGYLVIVFPQDAGTLSTLIVRPSDDDGLAEVRHSAAFDAVMRAVPHSARWTDPERFEPITGVLVGGNLTNTYRRQLGADGRPPLPGLIAVGDAVSTTNPMAGRGVALGLMQADALLDALAEQADPAAAAVVFDQWCGANIRPWYEDHVYWDATLLRRLAGHDLDLGARIPSDVICAAADEDPEIEPSRAMYTSMMGRPDVLRGVEERARAVLRTGWRPAFSAGPTRDELVELLGQRSASSAPTAKPAASSQMSVGSALMR